MPVLVSPLTVQAVGELLGASKCSSAVWVGFAARGLCEQDKSRFTEKPFSGSDNAMGTGATAIIREDMVAFLSTCSGRTATVLALGTTEATQLV